MPQTALFDEAYYRTLFAAAGDSMVVCDLESGRAIDCNEAAYQLLGTTRAQVLGSTPMQWSPEFQADGCRSEELAAKVFARVQQGESLSFEWIHRRADGNLGDVHVSIRPISIGAQRLAVVISRDITERKRAQAQLAESEARFRALFEMAPLAYQSLDLGANILAVNQAWLRLMGEKRQEDVVGRSITEFLEESSVPTLAQNFPLFVQSGRVEGPVFDVRARDGGTRRVVVNGRIGRDADGQPVRTHCILTDITERDRIESQRTEALSFLNAAFEQSPSGILIADAPDARIRLANQAAIQLLGAQPGIAEQADPMDALQLQALGAIWRVLRPDGSAYGTSELPLTRAVCLGETVHGETLRLVGADGQERWLLCNAAPIWQDGRIVSGIVVFHDITQERQAQAQLHLYARIFANSGEAIVITDHENRIVANNPAFTRLTGYTLEDLQGQNPRVLASGRTTRDTYISLWSHLQRDDFWLGELWDRHKDGSEHPKSAAISAIRDHQGQVTHYMASCVDITERKAAEARVDYLARHDVLTGLINRHDLESRMEQALRFAARESRHLVVLFIDLDRFKLINDAQGHAAGDRLLAQVAARLRGQVRESDIVARLGGDEFVVVLTDLADALDGASIAAALLDRLAEPYGSDDASLHCSASMGMAVYPQDAASIGALLQAADTAMYHAKAQGRGNVQCYTAAMNASVQERVHLEHDLRRDLAAGRLHVHYQPQIRSHDSCLCAMEALARWQHASLGAVPPDKFIRIAEECGLIGALGEWVLDAACAQLAAWHAQGLPGLRMAVNLSAQQLRAPNLAAMVQATLQRHGLQGQDLELEITESVAMADPERAIGQLQGLRALGVQLAIDDFGTGYSSLAYLKLLPIQTLKLDRAFVRDIENDENDAAISAATLALAHSLGRTVVAEGVETPGQRAFLQHHACDVLQGYLLGRPQSAEAWNHLWKDHPPVTAL